MHAVADRAGRERGVGERKAGLPAVAREQQRQRRRRGLEHEGPDRAPGLDGVVELLLGWVVAVQLGAEHVVHGEAEGAGDGVQELETLPLMESMIK
jgi:hypothetical protein